MDMSLIEIHSKKRAEEKLLLVASSAQVRIRSMFSWLDASIVFRHVAASTELFKQSTLLVHGKKLSALGIDSGSQFHNPDAVIFNFSSVTIPCRVKILLAFGLDFCLPVHKIDFYKYFLSFEKFIPILKSNKLPIIPEFSNRLQSLAYKYYYNFSPFKVFSSICSPDDIKLLRNFSKNDSIVVSRPDKGNGVVVVDRCRYVESMLKIISDPSKFEEIRVPIHKYTIKIEDKINNFLRKLKGCKLLSDEFYKKMFTSGSGPGILYGLPKVHKPNFCTNFQFRPIFAAYNTPSFNLAKFLVPILNPLTNNEYTVNNTHSFVNDVGRIGGASRYFMASFDVENLFTNISL